MIGFYNRDEKCLHRGTDWVFKYSSLHFDFKKLIYKLKLDVKKARLPQFESTLAGNCSKVNRRAAKQSHIQQPKKKGKKSKGLQPRSTDLQRRLRSSQ